jgi:thymidylate synthase
MKLISKNIRELAWFEALKHLYNEATDFIEYNLVVEVTEPVRSNKVSRQIRKSLDQLLADSPDGLYPVQTVADTIFPATEYKAEGMEGVYTTYPEDVFPKIKCNNGNTTGTYAYRIVRGFGREGKKCNPLENVISRLKGQLNRQKGGIRCAFEISVDDVASIPINRNDNGIMGFPCLSHLSFKLNHDRTALNLTATYRSQDFIQKALGNFLGLARLQDAVARELGIKVGVFVCHATLARMDQHTNLRKTKISKFIDETEELINGSG